LLFEKGEVNRRRVNASLYNLSPISFDGRSLFNRSVKERQSLSYITPSPFPLPRGRGTKGDGVYKESKNYTAMKLN